MKIIYLELPKFRRHLGTGYARTGLERWLLYFSNEEGERMNKAVAENLVLSAAKEIESMFWADEDEKERYFAYQRMLMDAYSAEHTHEYLITEARKEGIESVARSMLAKGIPVATIAECTGLGEKAILSLK
jgi:predicted transposase/invertase (TIGR01784 family)